ncbi:MAG: ATP phosphoribosyltransferase [Methanoregulaceae archaeon PtaB.Bin009]|nr:MAG: ATP phosphoribosyltransferase [Methanoregulaceae archaeon PtaB.Bin009]OPY38004.1 MAG: ATP phosphoribosyltransferase [Methanoregulaceae archaeon PtaU1.Bin066]HNQ29002.1 ATP phosphoribosyltransferase [Methanolinea sp.]HNS82603.1 ATP phosphoribosyltransferase [Methanolinea sp.]
MARSRRSEGEESPGPVARPQVLRLAIPNKGRISVPVNELMEKSGLHLLDVGERRLVSRTPDPHVEILFARPVDIPEYVANGAADLGITGHDMVLERKSDVSELLDLKIGSASLVLAVREDAGYTNPLDLEGTRVATEFPVISKEYFQEKGISVTLVPVGGACEATPYLGIAEAIVDLSSSGNTLRSNRLRVIDTVLPTTTMLIANPQSLASKGGKIEEIVLALESVVRARGQCYLMMNAKRACVDEVTSVLPGLSGPTVMEVASRQDMVAIHAVVDEERVYQLIHLLKRAGARDILVMPIERMIP